MALFDQIIAIYPTLSIDDFDSKTGTINLQDDGQGPYIKDWKNINPQPTQAELTATGK